MVKKVKRAAKKARKKPFILPRKLSSLIAIALKDIRKAEKVKTIILDMDTWFDVEQVECRTANDTLIETHNVCTICAAGSVMAFSLGKLGSGSELYPAQFPKNEQQLEAINDLREGSATRAFKQLNNIGYYDDTDERLDKYKPFDCDIPRYYRDDPEPFHKAMTKFKERLQKAGL